MSIYTHIPIIPDKHTNHGQSLGYLHWSGVQLGPVRGPLEVKFQEAKLNIGGLDKIYTLCSALQNDTLSI